MTEDPTQRASSQRAPSQSGDPVRLAYATPPPDTAAQDGGRLLLYLGRRLVFAVGVGLFMFGVGEGCATRRADAPEFLGSGAALIALVMPWGWRRPTGRDGEK